MLALVTESLREAALRAVLARFALDELGIALRESGIRAVVFKGALLALALPHFERSFEDIDLLVSPHDVMQAERTLSRLGYRAASRQAFATMFLHPERPLPVDLHGACFPPHLFRLSTNEVLDRARPEFAFAGTLRAPHPVDTYALMIGHFAKDRHDARRPERLRELSLVSAHYGLVPGEVADRLERYGLSRAARYVLGLAERAAEDAFAGTVVRSLPRDPAGKLAAAAAGLWIAQFAAGSPLTAPAAHVLNVSLVRGAASLGAHLKEAVPRRLAAGVGRAGHRRRS